MSLGTKGVYMDMQFDMENAGWINNPVEVEKVVSKLPIPMFTDAVPNLLQEKTDTFLYEYVRKYNKGADAPAGPQLIGDCVSWGWSNLANYLQCIQMSMGQRLSYQEICTEAMYALSRVEVGGQRGSYSDGSVGAWAAKAATQYGYLSRNYLAKQGLSPEYDARRAKDWGAKGLPDQFEPEAQMHLLQTTSLTTSFEMAAEAIQRKYPVAVCSNRGFSMVRDKDGFCSPSGVWNHCMVFVGVRWGSRPGLCLSQSWGRNTPSGPLAFNQPDNTFWVEADVADKMLRQGDSFAGSPFAAFPDLTVNDWSN